jgi:hypothetical protein
MEDTEAASGAEIQSQLNAGIAPLGTHSDQVRQLTPRFDANWAEWIMSKVSNPISFVLLAATLLVSGIDVSLQTNGARADDCLAVPNASARKGHHWYNGTDRQKGRKCNPISSVLLGTKRLLSAIEVRPLTNGARGGAGLAAPNASAPNGQHWYYGTDREEGRKCWVLHATIPLLHRIAAQLSFRVAAQLTGLFNRSIDTSGEYETSSSSGGNASSNDE